MLEYFGKGFLPNLRMSSVYNFCSVLLGVIKNCLTMNVDGSSFECASTVDSKTEMARLDNNAVCCTQEP